MKFNRPAFFILFFSCGVSWAAVEYGVLECAIFSFLEHPTFRFFFLFLFPVLFVSLDITYRRNRGKKVKVKTNFLLFVHLAADVLLFFCCLWSWRLPVMSAPVQGQAVQPRRLRSWRGAGRL